jgi:hypothetical protein
MPETPLTAVGDIPAALLKRLHQCWIQSAEQLVGLGATADGADTLARELDIDADQVHRLIASARAVLDPVAAEKLSRPVDTGNYPLGAMRPKHGPGRPTTER